MAFVVITHDLDFTTILASTEALGPSMIQVRTQDVLPDAIGPDIVRMLRAQRAALDQGAIVSVDELTSRGRVLPISKGIAGVATRWSSALPTAPEFLEDLRE